jgi:hypothetical protein
MVALVLPVGSLILAAACGSSKPANTGGGGGGGPTASATATASAEPEASSGASAASASGGETWVEETSSTPDAKVGPKGTNGREHHTDVTIKVVPKEGTTGPSTERVLRLWIRYAVPKVTPAGAREPHVVNRVLWEARKDLLKCYYAATDKQPSAEAPLIGWLAISKKGTVDDAGIESQGDVLEASKSFDECVLANLKGLSFPAAGDDVKARFRLKFEAADWTGKPDVVKAEEK